MINELAEVLKIFKRQNTFQYPLESLKDGYLDTLVKRLDEYIERIETLPDSEFGLFLRKEINSLNDMKNKIVSIIKLYLAGNAERAFLEFAEILNQNRTNIENLLLKVDIGKEILYRVRASEKEITSKEELFHIPFSKRHLVGTMRYSIAGVPSLYLANTIYGCWIEMDKPDLNKLYISKFKNAVPLNILDFAITFETLIKNPVRDDQRPQQYCVDTIKSFFLLYPLILSCSFKKQSENAKFNIEYIIPNMMLQWISNEKDHVHGIRYFSTKISHKRYDSIAINTVIPPKENKDSLEGFCPFLKRSFKFTPPLSWPMLNTFPIVVPPSDQRLHDNEKIIQSVEEVIDTHYKMTKFYEIERNIDYYCEFLLIDENTRPYRPTIDDWLEKRTFDEEESIT